MLAFGLAGQDPEVTFSCVTIDDADVYSLTRRRSQLSRR
jgi:hypothetical protein